LKKILGRIKLLPLSFQAMELVRLGYQPQHGVDYHFLTKAKGKKRILELLKSKGYIVEQL